jgi:hypothetical protein
MNMLLAATLKCLQLYIPYPASVQNNRLQTQRFSAIRLKKIYNSHMLGRGVLHGSGTVNAISYHWKFKGQVINIAVHYIQH